MCVHVCLCVWVCECIVHQSITAHVCEETTGRVLLVHTCKVYSLKLSMEKKDHILNALGHEVGIDSRSLQLKQNNEVQTCLLLIQCVFFEVIELLSANQISCPVYVGLDRDCAEEGEPEDKVLILKSSLCSKPKNYGFVSGPK